MRPQSLALSGLLALALALPAAARSSDAPWLHVRVTDAGGNDNVNLNVPFSIAEGLLQMVEQSEITMNVKEELPEGMTLQDIRKMWKELEGAGDAEFLTVQSGREEVRMAIEDESLLIDVVEVKRAGADQQVRLRVPTGLVDALLSGKGEELNLRAALQELRDGRIGDVLNVDGGDETVRIWID